MNATRWIRILAVAAAVTGFTATAIANEAEPSSEANQASTGSNTNSAAQLDHSAAPRRSGDSTTQHGTNNSAAQMGSGANGNAAAQLNNETQATSAPPVDTDSNTPEQATTNGAATATRPND
jgi:hypothetical protein